MHFSIQYFICFCSWHVIIERCLFYCTFVMLIYFDVFKFGNKILQEQTWYHVFDALILFVFSISNNFSVNKFSFTRCFIKNCPFKWNTGMSYLYFLYHCLFSSSVMSTFSNLTWNETIFEVVLCLNFAILKCLSTRLIDYSHIRWILSFTCY